MTVIFGSHEALLDHDTGPFHPERPDRLHAVTSGVRRAGMENSIVPFRPRPATVDELALVHGRSYVRSIEETCESGGGHLDPDTCASAGSFGAALVAAGAGQDAAERLRAGEADAAFLALRPPGHHAAAGKAMGFCLFNNIAVTAAAIASRGERVLIIDWDAHHGNGTQEMFWHDPAVFYLSIHQYPFYPGTGALGDVGEGRGRGATLNVPLPAGSTGQVYRAAMEEVMAAAAERHCPDWLLVSAGFDAHRDDPLTDLGLSAGDFADMTAFCATIVPPGRRIFFLEGGYDLQALELSVEACIRALGGDFAYPEPPSRPGPADEMGREAVFSAARLHFG